MVSKSTKPINIKETEKMLYRAKPQYLILIYALLVAFLTTTTSSNALLYLFCTLILFITLSAFLNYEFRIENEKLFFIVLFFTIPIYKQTVSHKEIMNIKFKRLGWVKGAKVKVKGKFSLRLSRFQSNEMFSDLNNFAQEYNIPTEKTKDFGRL